jgi:hypothetical protein
MMDESGFWWVVKRAQKKQVRLRLSRGVMTSGITMGISRPGVRVFFSGARARWTRHALSLSLLFGGPAGRKRRKHTHRPFSSYQPERPGTRRSELSPELEAAHRIPLPSAKNRKPATGRASRPLDEGSGVGNWAGHRCVHARAKGVGALKRVERKKSPARGLQLRPSSRRRPSAPCKKRQKKKKIIERGGRRCRRPLALFGLGLHLGAGSISCCVCVGL